ncbi:MAG: GTP-dependent dephospho-CoA kinase family protein [Candidatus Odinarchaeum yellowstonii]|uniref:GTP-dependent dephospho-CoA kinase n=1 Tax=Odinarchaeota yellowstonii (strain LCB_4) TaxID=1841599 RepID=A0AAF0IB87_ODILC|nr:MAG: GTP-dependent dephospho-CoA kinase family protein [Candidatus Odinarchaeum yellowstonii]
MKTLKITPHLRDYLKKPLGKLIRLKNVNQIKKLLNELDKYQPVKIISVGDVVTESLLKNRITPDLYIIDGKTLRNEFKSTLISECNLKIINKPGTINSTAWTVIKSCLEQTGKKGLLVEGEEDLLVLPSVILAPLGAVVLYGQPNEGVVIIKVDLETKTTVKKILDLMEETADE